MKIELFYDKECPFCNSYANYIKLKEKNELSLLNARESKKEIQKLKEQGFDINNGFIIRVDEKEFYQGADAILFLNRVSKNRVFFLDNSFFKIYLYSFIKFLRKLVLTIMGKKRNI